METKRCQNIRTLKIEQLDAINDLIQGVSQLSTTVPSSGSKHPTETFRVPSKEPRWFYRASSDESRGNFDLHGDIVSGNPNISLRSVENIAFQFAEFHSDMNNQTDTPLISGTDDLVRALRKAKWFLKGCKSQIFITIFQSSEYYMAKDLIERARMPAVWSSLSSGSQARLNNYRNKNLYKSEVIFVRHIPKERISLRVSLQTLENKGLESLLPSLSTKKNWPKLIRGMIGTDSVDIFSTLYSLLCQQEPGNQDTRESLKKAEELLLGDPYLTTPEKEEGRTILQHKRDMISASRIPPTMLQLRNKSDPNDNIIGSRSETTPILTWTAISTSQGILAEGNEKAELLNGVQI